MMDNATSLLRDDDTPHEDTCLNNSKTGILLIFHGDFKWMWIILYALGYTE